MMEVFTKRNETINNLIEEGKGVELLCSGYLTSDEQGKVIEILALKREKQKEVEQTASSSIPNLKIRYGHKTQ